MTEVHCVECRKPIRPDLAFCPGCGADNRAPEHRTPVAPHLHDFSLGSYCFKCGENYVAEGKKAPVHGYVFRSYTGLGAAVVCLLFLGYFIFPSYYDRPFISVPVAIGLAVVILAVGFAIQSRVLIDLDKKEVRVVAGMWPIIHVARHAMSEVSAIQIGIRTSYGRYNNVYYHFQVLLLMDRNDQLLEEYSDSVDAFDKAKELSTVLDVPLEDLTGMQMGQTY